MHALEQILPDPEAGRGGRSREEGLPEVSPVAGRGSGEVE